MNNINAEKDLDIKGKSVMKDCWKDQEKES